MSCRASGYSLRHATVPITNANFDSSGVKADSAGAGLNGYDVARHLRAVPALQEALLVAVTGYGQMLDRVMSVLAGIDHHLVKPLNTEALVKLIKAHLARRSERAPGQDVLPECR